MAHPPPPQARPFGVTRAGAPVACFRLERPSGAAAEVLSCGGVLRRVEVPDGRGRPVSVCLGRDTLAQYEADGCYLGGIIGRCAGRIAAGRLPLNGLKYRLAVNDPPNHLHGGAAGFHRRVWDAFPSPGGEEGYPGALEAAVTYAWEDDHTLALTLEALALDDTLVSLTHHGYWNLAGADAPSALENWFETPAERFAEVDGHCLPTGALSPVAGTPFDFRAGKPVGRDIGSPHPQLAAGSGYDHTFLVPGCGLRRAGALWSPATGISMAVETTLPGLHLYSGSSLPLPRSALALEAQFLPDAVHHPSFPSVLLERGARWRHQIKYRFFAQQ